MRETRTVDGMASWSSTWMRGALVVGLGLAALVVGGCKQKVAGGFGATCGGAKRARRFLLDLDGWRICRTLIR